MNKVPVAATEQQQVLGYKHIWKGNRTKVAVRLCAALK